MRRYILLVIFLVLVSQTLNAQAIVPQPNFIENRSGNLLLEKAVKLQYSNQLNNEATLLQQYLTSDFGLSAAKSKISC